MTQTYVVDGAMEDIEDDGDRLFWRSGWVLYSLTNLISRQLLLQTNNTAFSRIFQTVALIADPDLGDRNLRRDSARSYVDATVTCLPVQIVLQQPRRARHLATASSPGLSHSDYCTVHLLLPKNFDGRLDMFFVCILGKGMSHILDAPETLSITTTFFICSLSSFFTFSFCGWVLNG